MKIRNGFVSNSSSSSFIVKYTNKSGHDIKVSDIIQQNRDTFISYLDYYNKYGKNHKISTKINKELENAIKSDIVISNDYGVMLHMESDGDFYRRLSIVDLKNIPNCGFVDEHITIYE